MMRKLAEKHGKPYEECVADAGYESQENYLYLAQNGQVCFINHQLRPEEDKEIQKNRSVGSKTWPIIMTMTVSSVRRGEN